MLFSSLGLMILRPGMSEQLGASALFLAMMTAMNVRYQPHLHVLQRRLQTGDANARRRLSEYLISPG